MLCRFPLSVLVEATFFAHHPLAVYVIVANAKRARGCASPALTFATKFSRKDKLYLYHIDIDFDTDIVVDTNTQQIQIIIDIEIEM